MKIGNKSSLYKVFFIIMTIVKELVIIHQLGDIFRALFIEPGALNHNHLF